MRAVPRGWWIVVVIVIAAVAVTFGITAFQDASSKRLTAYFSNSVGLYEGDTVRVLGVSVGTIDEIVPQGTQVEIRMTVRGDVKIPRDAEAAIIAPTLVTGRYVQFSPVYSGGPQMADGGSVPLDRTAVPVPYDEIKTQLSKLTAELGPKGLNKDGSVTRFVDSSAAALDGNGKTINGSITEVSKLADTLAKGGPDLFSTIRNLSDFVRALSANSDQIASFNTQLGGVAGVLAGNRTELDVLLKTLASAVNTIERVVSDNRGKLKGDISSLQRVTGLLKTRQDDLAQIMHSTPTALGDLYNIYDPSSNSLTGNFVVPDIPDPKTLICALLTTVNAPQSQCKAATAAFSKELTSQMLQRQGASAPKTIAGLLNPASTAPKPAAPKAGSPAPAARGGEPR